MRHGSHFQPQNEVLGDTFRFFTWMWLPDDDDDDDGFDFTREKEKLYGSSRASCEMSPVLPLTKILFRKKKCTAYSVPWHIVGSWGY